LPLAVHLDDTFAIAAFLTAGQLPYDADKIDRIIEDLWLVTAPGLLE
jgi:hypothetical protein